MQYFLNLEDKIIVDGADLYDKYGDSSYYGIDVSLDGQELWTFDYIKGENSIIDLKNNEIMDINQYKNQKQSAFRNYISENKPYYIEQSLKDDKIELSIDESYEIISYIFSFDNRRIAMTVNKNNQIYMLLYNIEEKVVYDEIELELKNLELMQWYKNNMLVCQVGDTAYQFDLNTKTYSVIDDYIYNVKLISDGQYIMYNRSPNDDSQVYIRDLGTNKDYTITEEFFLDNELYIRNVIDTSIDYGEIAKNRKNFTLVPARNIQLADVDSYVTDSSSHRENENEMDYASSNVLDGLCDTAWVEGVDGQFILMFLSSATL